MYTCGRLYGFALPCAGGRDVGWLSILSHLSLQWQRPAPSPFAKLSEAQMLFEPGKMSAPRRSPALTYNKPLRSVAVYSGYCALGPFAFVLPSN